MTDSNRQTNRSLLLAGNLVLLFICAAGLAVVIFLTFLARRTAESSAPTASATFRLTLTFTSLPTVTPTKTESLPTRPTSTPTITLTPTITQTPSKTPTPTGFPIQAASRPTVFPSAYKLVDWDAGKADNLARQLQGYPEAARIAHPDQSEEAYYDSYRYPAFALEEALLRYPDAPEADSWRWTLAYNQVLSSNPEAGDTYADLIAGGLNKGRSKLISYMPGSSCANHAWILHGSVENTAG